MKYQTDQSNNINKLKVLHVISHYELGGAEKCTFELTHLIYGRVEIGVAAVIGNDNSEVGKSLTQQAKYNGISIFNGISLTWKFGGFLVAAIRLRNIIRQFRPDIIHLNTEIPEFSYALCLSIFPSLKRIPVIRTIHNTILWSRWQRLGTWCEKKLGDIPVIYVSEAVRDSFQKWRSTCGLEPVTSDITIFNPITVPFHRKQLINLRIQQKEIRLLFAGRFEFQKGCDLLPEIVKLVRNPENILLSLFIYGEGTDEATLTELEDSPPLNWQVKLSPPLTNLVESLPDFDILLFPSRFEGYGRLAAEAVLMGIPVVAFRLPVLLEIFPADYPWLVPFNDQDVSGYADSISTLLASINDAQPIVDNARKLLSSKLNPETTALAYLDYYKQVHENNLPHAH